MSNKSTHEQEIEFEADLHEDAKVNVGVEPERLISKSETVGQINTLINYIDILHDSFVTQRMQSKNNEFELTTQAKNDLLNFRMDTPEFENESTLSARFSSLCFEVIRQLGEFGLDGKRYDNPLIRSEEIYSASMTPQSLISQVQEKTEKKVNVEIDQQITQLDQQIAELESQIPPLEEKITQLEQQILALDQLQSNLKVLDERIVSAENKKTEWINRGFTTDERRLEKVTQYTTEAVELKQLAESLKSESEPLIIATDALKAAKEEKDALKAQSENLKAQSSELISLKSVNAQLLEVFQEEKRENEIGQTQSSDSTVTSNVEDLPDEPGRTPLSQIVSQQINTKNNSEQAESKNKTENIFTEAQLQVFKEIDNILSNIDPTPTLNVDVDDDKILPEFQVLLDSLEELKPNQVVESNTASNNTNDSTQPQPILDEVYEFLGPELEAQKTQTPTKAPPLSKEDQEELDRFLNEPKEEIQQEETDQQETNQESSQIDQQQHTQTQNTESGPTDPLETQKQELQKTIQKAQRNLSILDQVADKKLSTNLSEKIAKESNKFINAIESAKSQLAQLEKAQPQQINSADTQPKVRPTSPEKPKENTDVGPKDIKGIREAMDREDAQAKVVTATTVTATTVTATTKPPTPTRVKDWNQIAQKPIVLQRATTPSPSNALKEKGVQFIGGMVNLSSTTAKTQPTQQVKQTNGTPQVKIQTTAEWEKAQRQSLASGQKPNPLFQNTSANNTSNHSIPNAARGFVAQARANIEAREANDANSRNTAENDTTVTKEPIQPGRSGS